MTQLASPASPLQAFPVMPRHLKASRWLPGSASPMCSVPTRVLLPQHMDACARPPTHLLDAAPGPIQFPQTWHKEQGTPKCLFCLGNPSPRARVRARCDSPRGRYLWRDARAVSLRPWRTRPALHAGCKDHGSRCRLEAPSSSQQFPARSLGLRTRWLEPHPRRPESKRSSGPPT